MEFIKTKTGWLNLETNNFLPFGEIAMQIYNEFKEIDLLIYEKVRKHFNINTPLFHIIGRHHAECHTEDILFENDDKMIALISSEDKLNSEHTLKTYSHDGWNTGKIHYYIAIYKSDMESMFNNSPYYTNFIMDIVKNQRFRHFIERLCDQGEKNLYPTGKYEIVNAQILDTWLNNIDGIDMELQTVIRKYNNIYYRVLIADNIDQLIYDDLIEMINFNYSLKHCPICHVAFIKRDKRKNFCPSCSLDEKAKKQYNDQKRKKSPKALHKNICDMLRNRNQDYSEFMIESDYYWDIINGKNIVYNNKYDKTIKTKSDYRAWLKKKHEEYKRR